MPSKDFYVQNRVKNVFKNIKDKIDIILIKNSTHPFIDDNFFYITNLSKGIFEGSAAVLYPDGKIDIITSTLESESALKSKLPIHIYNNLEEYKIIFKKLTSSYKNIGLNFSSISHRDFCNIKNMLKKKQFIDISKELMNTRLIKDNLEISKIQKACNISDSVMKKIPDLIYENMYEYEIAAEIEYYLQKLGADRSAFEIISSFNKNTAEPHYSHGDVKLKKGDFALFDFGARVKKYNSDITRTFVFGKADKKQKEMYETVRLAQQAGLDEIKPDVMANDVHKTVLTYINKTKFKGCFIHSTGHSLGLSVHDGEYGLNQNGTFLLKENMVFTIEPGVYISGFGGVRIEDDIVVKKDGFKLLSKHPRELLEI